MAGAAQCLQIPQRVIWIVVPAALAVFMVHCQYYAIGFAFAACYTTILISLQSRLPKTTEVLILSTYLSS